MTAPPLVWRWRRFDELGVVELDAIYRARQQVFVIEQNCAYLDADGCDAASCHLTAHRAGDLLTPLAYARVVAPGIKYAEASIGRVLTSDAARGAGLGRELVGRAIGHCRATFAGSAIRISAQARLTAFYAGFGFASVGEVYLEDDIPHIEMLLASP